MIIKIKTLGTMSCRTRLSDDGCRELVSEIDWDRRARRRVHFLGCRVEGWLIQFTAHYLSDVDRDPFTILTIQNWDAQTKYARMKANLEPLRDDQHTWDPTPFPEHNAIRIIRQREEMYLRSKKELPPGGRRDHRRRY